MKNLVTEIKAIPGVIGACCYHSQKGLVANSLPGLFKPDKLLQIGKHIARLLAAGRLNFPDLTDIVLQYEETTLVGKSLDQNLVLAVLCDPGINMNLLTMSLNLAMENLPSKAEEQPPAVQPPPDSESAAPPPKDLEPVRSSLAKVVGPMATIMFEEALNEARQTGATGKALLTHLENILVREIGDETMADQFRQLLATSLAGGN